MEKIKETNPEKLKEWPIFRRRSNITIL